MTDPVEDKLRALHDVNRCDSVECERGFDCYVLKALRAAYTMGRVDGLVEAADRLLEESRRLAIYQGLEDVAGGLRDGYRIIRALAESVRGKEGG